jgi:hypothetical protein
MNRGGYRFEHPDEGPGARAGPLRKDVRAVADERWRGAAVRTLPRANRTYTSGRVCAEPGCETKLSMYNKWLFCWQHEPVHQYIPRGKRKSRKQAA